MNAFRIAWTELRRITATRGGRVTVLALLLVPFLYGGAYLFANRDPYGALDQVPAALVVLDKGATDSNDEPMNVGREVVDQLLEDHAFDWHEVDAEEAAEGVRTGRYDFALTFPKGFSAAIASAGTSESRQAELVLTTNDANNYLAHTMATQATEQVRASIAATVGEEAANTFLSGFSTVADKMVAAAEGAGQLADGASKAQAGAQSAASGASDLSSGLNTLATSADKLADGAKSADAGAQELNDATGSLSEGLTTLKDKTADLPGQAKALADGATQVAGGVDQLDSSAQKLASGSKAVSDGLGSLASALQAQLTAAGMPAAQVAAVVGKVTALQDGSNKVSNGLDSLAAGTKELSSGAHQVADGAGQLADSAPDLAAGIADAQAGAAKIHTGAGDLADGTGQLATGSKQLAAGAHDAADGGAKLAAGTKELAAGLADLTAGANELQSKLEKGAASLPAADKPTRTETAANLADPVRIKTIANNPAANYGSGLAPFFLTLALWIGGYVLFLLIRPLSRRALAADQPSWRIAIAGWLTPALLGTIQAILLIAVVVVGVDITPVQPLATIAFMVLVSVTFVAIIQALCAWLGTAGQFVALVLMILQLVSAGGTFPWQTLPEPLRTLHAGLPMSHAITGLRQLFYGGDSHTVVVQVGVMVTYLLIAVLFATLAARRQRMWTPGRLQPAVVL